MAAKDELEVKHQMMTLLERLLLTETLLYHVGHYLLQSQRALGNQKILTESQDSTGIGYWRESLVSTAQTGPVSRTLWSR